MANYHEARVKLTNTQLNKLKSTGKNKTWAIIRITRKKIDDEEFPNELFLTTTQTTKIRNVIAKNISTYIKLSQEQLSKMIQLGWFLHNMLDNSDEKVITDLSTPLARNYPPGLTDNLASNAINKFERTIS